MLIQRWTANEFRNSVLILCLITALKKLPAKSKVNLLTATISAEKRLFDLKLFDLKRIFARMYCEVGTGGEVATHIKISSQQKPWKYNNTLLRKMANEFNL